MTIKVSVRNSLEPAPPWEVVLPEPLATIGRQASCAVVLSDPEKHVSRVHATVELRGSAYFLTVNSRVNPVLVDGQPCEPGTGVELRNGASLVIHPFELSIQVTPPAMAAAASPFGGLMAPAPMAPPPAATFASPQLSAPAAPFSPPPPAAPAADDPFGWLDGFSAKPSTGGAVPSDPFGLGQLGAPAAPKSPLGQADPFRQAAPPPSTGLVDGLTPGLGGIGRSGTGAVSLEAAPASLDPMALLGGAPASLSGLLQPGAANAGASTSVDDFLGIGLGPARGPSSLVDMGQHRHVGSSNLDHVHDFNLPFQPGAPVDLPAWDTPPMVAAAAVTPIAPATPAPPAAPASGASSDALLAAFLTGLGAPAFNVPPGGEQAFFRQAGEIVHSAVQGLITLLLARGEVKKELRASDRTMLAAHNNNPLKFMAATDEAMRFLFDPKAANAGAFLSPVQAISDACDELIAHEMGLVAGMRAAVTASIKRFDPAVTEQVAEKMGGMVLNKKARLWDLHAEHYAKTEREMVDNLDRLFEGEFLRAYSEQVWRMQQKS